MVFGTTTFKCDNCGERFEGIAAEWCATAKGSEGQVHGSAEGQRNLSCDSRFAHKINENKRILQKVNPLGRDFM